MAIKTFNSVGGFSVGESITTVIDSNSNVTASYANFSGNVSIFQGNVDALRIKTDNLLYANGDPWDFDSANGSTDYVQFKGSSGDLAGNINFTFSESGNLFSANSNANIAGARFVYENGNANVTANYFIGKFDGAISGAISSPGSNTEVAFNDDGILNVSSKLTFIKTSGNLTVTGNADLGNLTTSNYFHGYFDSLSNNQSNITQVGTLINANVSGNLAVGNVANVGNLKVNTAVVSNLIPSVDNTYTLGNATNMWGNIWTGSNIWIGTGDAYLKASGDVIQTANINVFSKTTTLDLKVRQDSTFDRDVTISGNLTVSGTTTYINATNLSTIDPLISLGADAAGGNIASYDGKDRGLVLRNYNAVADRVNNQFLGWSSASNEFRAVADISSIIQEVVTPNASATGSGYANVRAYNFLGNVYGTVKTAAQGDITSLGTLTGLTVHTAGMTGNVTTDNANVLGVLKVSGLTYPIADGTPHQVLETDGAGTLSFTTIDTYRIANGTSVVTVNGPGGNIELTSAGVTTLTVTDTWANVTGNAYVSNNFTVNNIATVGSLTFKSYSAADGSQLSTTSSIRTQSFTTTSISSNQTIAQIDITGTGYRAAEFFIKGENPAGGKYTVATVHAIHNGSTLVDWVVFGSVNIGAALHTGYSVTLTAGTTLRLRVSPSTTDSIVWTTQIRLI